jgi:tetratricopeptide (TPR) repeat protein
LTILLAVVPVALAEPPPAPTKEQIARWIEQLGDGDFTVREKASRALWEAGQAAEVALAAANKSDDPEVKRRAGEILQKFKWGIYPDTPREIVGLIERYRTKEANDKAEVVKELFEMGSRGCAVLVKLAAAEDDNALRLQLFGQITRDAARALPAMLAEEKFEALEELLELSVVEDQGDVALQNLAAFWLLRGKLDDGITRLQAHARKHQDNNLYPQALTYLYRAKGDWAHAREAADKASRQDLVEQVLLDQRDWAELAKLYDQTDLGNVERLGYRAAFHRLAGNAKGLEQALADLRKNAADKMDDLSVWLPAKALFLNGASEDALELTARKGHKVEAAFEILCAQLKFHEAFELAAKVTNSPELAIAQARVQYLLGEKEKAVALFTRFGDAVKKGEHDPLRAKIIQTEHRLGLQDEALAQVASLLGRPEIEDQQDQLLDLVFPKQGKQALVWWHFLREKNPKEDAVVALKRVGDLVLGKLGGPDLESLTADAAQAAQQRLGEEQEAWLLAIAETALAAGRDTIGRTYLDKAAAIPEARKALIRLGDFHAERKAWEQAVEAYAQAWKKDKKQPLPLFLQGWALAQSGAAVEGRKLMDLAHWLPLGDESARFELAKELTQRGHGEAARREQELLLRVSQPGSFTAGETQRQLALAAVAKKELLKAADLQELSTLRCLQPNTEFLVNEAYVGVPHFIHRLRARALAAAGRLDEAKREADFCESLLPGNIDLAIHVVPELEKRGQKKEADDRFTHTLQLHEKLCGDYPRSAWAHNNLAWLCACCRRNLDGALEHARKAVELAPDQTGYLDTLAEVHFQRGDRDRAIEAMKKCLAKDGKNSYYRKQLKRFEAGDNSVEVPSAGDDDDD